MKFTRDFSFLPSRSRNSWLASYQIGGTLPAFVFDYQRQRYGSDMRMSFDATHSFSRSSEAWSYDALGRFEAQAIDVPRFTSDFDNPAPRGLVVESSKNNALPHASTSGAVLGALDSGGALPNGWSITGMNPSDVWVEDISATDALPRIRLRMTGTPSNKVNVFFCGATEVPASNIETWTLGLFAALTTGSLANVTSLSLSTSGWTSSGGFVSGSTLVGPNLVSSLTSELAQFEVIGSIGNAASERIRPSIRLFTSGDIDLTLDLALPSATSGAAPLVDIPTQGAAFVQSGEMVAITGVSPGIYDVLTKGERTATTALLAQAVSNNYWPVHLNEEVVQSVAFYPTGTL